MSRYKKSSKNSRSFKNLVQDINENDRNVRKKPKILPRNLSQEKFISYLENTNVDICFAVGPAGSGKTLLATQTAIKQLQEGQIDKIIITRPAVSVEESHGYLPGTLVEKMHPWVLPIIDIFNEYYSKSDIEKLIEHGQLEIAPLAYMRGRSFHNCFIIGDEMQNSTPSQMKMFLTRIGKNSKMIITGDMAQHDRGFEENGLKDFLNRYKQHDRISVTFFTAKDVERNPVIEDLLKFYGEK